MPSEVCISAKKRSLDKVARDFIDNHDADVDGKLKLKLITLYESNTFLACHLKVLRALYTTANKSAAGSCEDSCLRDEAVSEEVWEMIERFLGQQHELRRIKRQAHQWRTIADESSEHVKKQMEQKEQDQQLEHQQLPNTAKSPIQYPQASPIEKRLFSSPYGPPVPPCAPTTAMTASTTYPASTTSTTRTCASTLASKLLDRRARVAENMARQVVHPYQELYVAVCHRSERLDSLAHQSQSSSTEVSVTSNDAVNDQGKDCNDEKRKQDCGRSVKDDQRRNSLYEVEAKNRLWKKLANDLYNVIHI